MFTIMKIHCPLRPHRELIQSIVANFEILIDFKPKFANFLVYNTWKIFGKNDKIYQIRNFTNFTQIRLISQVFGVLNNEAHKDAGLGILTRIIYHFGTNISTI